MNGTTSSPVSGSDEFVASIWSSADNGSAAESADAPRAAMASTNSGIKALNSALTESMVNVDVIVIGGAEEIMVVGTDETLGAVESIVFLAELDTGTREAAESAGGG